MAQPIHQRIKVARFLCQLYRKIRFAIRPSSRLQCEHTFFLGNCEHVGSTLSEYLFRTASVSQIATFFRLETIYALVVAAECGGTSLNDGQSACEYGAGMDDVT